MFKKSIQKGLFLLIALMLVVTGCGNGNNGANSSSTSQSGSSGSSTNTATPSKEAAEPVTISFASFGSEEELAIYQKAIDVFEAENPDIHVELQSFPRAEYNQKMLTELAGGNAADVFAVKPETLAKMRESGSLKELSAFLESDNSYVKVSDYFEGFWGGAKIGDEVYGVSVDVNPMFLYYNTAIFEELGLKSPQQYYDEGSWSWATFKELAQQVAASGKRGYGLDTYWATMHSWIFSNGGRVFDDNGNYVLDQNQKAQESIAFLKGLLDDNAAVYTGALSEGISVESLLMSNQLAFLASGRWITPTLLANNFKDFDYIPFPTQSGEKLTDVATTIVFISTNAKTEHPEEAMRFLSYFVSAESQKIRLAGGNAVPSVKGAESLITEATVPEHASYLLDMREIAHSPSGPTINEYNYAGLDAEIKAAYEMLFTGKVDVDGMVEFVTEKVNEMMK